MTDQRCPCCNNPVVGTEVLTIRDNLPIVEKCPFCLILIERVKNPNPRKTPNLYYIRRRYNLEQVREILDKEGFGYAIQHYMDGSRIADPKLAKMWDDARALLVQIEEYVGE
jgi:hypothetical protein